MLVLLGFAATDFVITMTLSAADAAEHAIENPYFQPVLGDHQVLVTLAILVVLAAVFLKGFRRRSASPRSPRCPTSCSTSSSSAAAPGRSCPPGARRRLAKRALGEGRLLDGDGGRPPRLPEARARPERLRDRRLGDAADHGGETDRGHDPRRDGPPAGRIRNTRKLLLAAAAIMSVMLLLSSFVTTLLIAPADYQEGGKAAGRAIAFLAHRYLGPGFGTVYDVSTILILWFAGASAMAGLLHLIPRYLPRFGMAPHWVVALAAARPRAVRRRRRGDARVRRRRRGAERRLRDRRAGADPLGRARGDARALARAAAAPMARVLRRSLFLVFAYTLVDNCIERPDGLIIGTHLHAAADAVERHQPLHALDRAAHPARVLRGRRELAPGTGAARQEGPPRPVRSSSPEARQQEEGARSRGTTR